jgi:hypothetical protein
MPFGSIVGRIVMYFPALNLPKLLISEIMPKLFLTVLLKALCFMKFCSAIKNFIDFFKKIRQFEKTVATLQRKGLLKYIL